jgi:hypothetical protein
MPPTAKENRICLFRFAQDAWENGLRQWLRGHADVCLNGGEAWMVVADVAQGAWVRRRALAEGFSLLGIKFLTAGSLRRELSRRLGVDARSLGRDSLEFLLKLEALEHRGAEARSVALNPSSCLQALDDLGRAGWSGEEADIGEIPSPVRNWLGVLVQSGAWTSSIDRELREKSSVAAAPGLHLCFWAWDHEFRAERILFEAALGAAVSVRIFLPLALQPAEYMWVEELEQLCGAQHEACAASEFSSANENFVDYLSRKGEADASGELPSLAVGEKQADQLALIERQIMAWLPECGDEERIGVVFPPAAPQARVLVTRLAQLGVPVLDEARRRVAPGWNEMIQQKLAAYYLHGRQVGEFLTLTAGLNQRRDDCWKLEPIQLRRALHRNFSRCPTRNVSVLLENVADDAPKILFSAQRLARALGAWPETGGWGDLKERWQAACAQLGASVDCLEPLWSRLDSVLLSRKQPISGRAFLEYVAQLLSPLRYVRDAEGDHAFAKVLVTTSAQAACQSWKHLIFADSNEGRWPAPGEENPFLNDALRKKLNQRKGAGHEMLLTTVELARLGQRRLLDLLENCAGETLFTAVAFDEERPEQNLYPNEIALQLLMLESSGDAVLKRWERKIQKAVPSLTAKSAVSSLADAEREYLAKVASSRRDASAPFDEYSFCYSPELPGAKPWAVTTLDKLKDFPASTALELLFHAASSENESFQRSENWFAGILLHEWMRRYFAAGIPPLASMAERVEQIEAELKREFAVGGSLWSETTFRSARWALRECLQVLYAEGVEQWQFVLTEEQISGEIETAKGLLRLSGRMDLVLRDRAQARVKIIDFKTSKRDVPTLAKLANGEGLQFGAYLLLACTAEANEVSVQCVSPRLAGKRLLTKDDIEVARQGVALAAERQNTLRFGIGAKMHSEYGRAETLPLATLPIESEILKAKQVLTFGDANGEAKEGGDE